MADDAQVPKKEFNALEFLDNNIKIADRFVLVAQDYLDLVNRSPRPDIIESGDFFLTLDGSLVQVIEAIYPTPSACPACGGQHTPGQGILIMPTEQGLSVRQATTSQDGDGDEDENEPAPATATAEDKGSPSGYVCSIVKGGHGLKHLYGEKPGEKYGVDTQGLALIPNNDPKGVGVLCTFQICLVGLSLKTRMRASFVAAQADATAHPEKVNA